MAKRTINANVATLVVPTIVNNTNSVLFNRIKKLLSERGQLGGSKYDKRELLLTIDADDQNGWFSDVEEKVTNDGRKFYLLWFSNPDDRSEKLSLPISGAEDNAIFEIWDCIANCDFSANGKIITKGTERVRCYSIED